MFGGTGAKTLEWLFDARLYERQCLIWRCFSNFVRPPPGKFLFFFFKDEGPAPTDLLVNTFPVFLSSYINPLDLELDIYSVDKKNQLDVTFCIL